MVVACEHVCVSNIVYVISFSVINLEECLTTKTAQNHLQTRSSTQALNTTYVPAKSTSTKKPVTPHPTYNHDNCILTKPRSGRISKEEINKMIEYTESPEYEREHQEMMETMHLRAETWQRSQGFRPHPRHGRQHAPVFK